MPFGVCDPANPSFGDQVVIWFFVSLGVAAYLGGVMWLVHTGRGARWRLALGFVLGAAVPTLVLWSDAPGMEARYDDAFLAAAVVALAASALAWRRAVRGFFVAALGAGGALLFPFAAFLLTLYLGWGCIG